MRYTFLLFCISLCCFANAQHSLRYAGSVEGGLLMNSSTKSSFVFTTQGVAYKQYTLGLGSGIDFYPLRSVPLFVDVKRKFTAHKMQPFIEAAAGINFTGNNSNDAQWYHLYAGDGKFDNGFFAKGSGGIILRAQKKWQFAISAGYSYKTTTYNYKPFTGTPWVGQIQPLKDIFHYNRWYLGVGVLW